MANELLRKLLREKKSEASDLSVSEFLRLVSESSTEGASIAPDEQAKILKSRYDAFQIRHAFEPGQLVRWKKGFRNREAPKDDEPAIVINSLDVPIFDPELESGSPYFRESLDLQLAVLVQEGVFAIFHFDGRRFEPFEK